MEKKYKILVVDGEETSLGALTKMLASQEEWEIESAASGLEALAKIRKTPADMVLSASDMPEMNGFELLAAIEKNAPKTVRVLLFDQEANCSLLRYIGAVHTSMKTPCDKDALIHTVTRAFTLRERLGNARLITLVSSLRSIPTPPEIYYEVMQALKNPHTSLDAIGDLISKDIALSAKLMQLTNSAFFGATFNVRTPRQAVNLLGLDNIHTLVLTCSIMTQFSPTAIGKTLFNQLWEHSLQVSLLGQKIAAAEGFERAKVDEVAIAGILHDIGILVLAANLGQEYLKVLEIQLEKKVSRTAAEKAVFGVTHAEVGSYLLALWGLYDEVIEAVAYHEDPWDCYEPTNPILWCVYAANTLLPNQKNPKEIDAKYAKRINKDSKLAFWKAMAEEIKAGG